MAIGTVVFDLGGVICRYRPERRLRELALICGRAPEDVHRLLYGSGFVGETERGQWDAAQIVSEVGARLGCVVGRAELTRAWLAPFEVDDEVLELAGRIAEGRRTAIFTNNDLLLREALLDARPELAARFDSIVFSAEVQTVKPAAEAFRRAFVLIGTVASEVLFVDDSDTNVTGALHAGASAIRFRDARRLAAELDGYGIF
jgi:glucose-1-phosphatase